MEKKFKYDPEDIESLLMHKQFNELFEEEREFVLQHIESEEEYESLRKTLYDLHDASLTEDWLEPEPSIKAALMKEFAQEKRGGFRIWLNSLFAMPEVVWYRRPSLQIAFAGICALVAVVFVLNMKDHTLATAENGSNNNSVSTPSQVEEEGENLFAENMQVKEFPPAPKTILTPPVSDESIKSVANSSSLTEEVKNVSSPVEEAPMIESAESMEADDHFISNSNTDSKMIDESMSEDLKDRHLEKEISSSSTSPASKKLAEVTQLSGTATTISSVNSGAADAIGYNWVAQQRVSASMTEVKDLLSILYTAP